MENALKINFFTKIVRQIIELSVLYEVVALRRASDGI